MDSVPAPLEWHPAYRKHTHLIDWLQGRGEYADRDRILVPRSLSRIAYTRTPADQLNPDASRRPVHVLTRRRCVGLAPYVGRPFYYEWWAATDELNRHIAGDARIVYYD